MKLSDIRIRPVLLGVLADIAGSTLVGVALAIVIVAIGGIGHDLSPTHLEELRKNVPLKLAGLIGTSISTGVGGYVAARLGRPHGFIHSLAVGFVCLVLGIALATLNPGVTPLWKVIAGTILTIPAALVGGRCARGHSAPTVADIAAD